MAKKNALLSIKDIHQSLGGKKILDGITFDVAAGETTAVLGPSGSGKSTLLAVIAGLQNPLSGRVDWDGENITDMPPHQRGFGLMFQDFVLFPHMNVYQNAAFGLSMAGLGATEVEEKVRAALSLVGLDGFEKRDPSSLSGGEQQRVALARSLAPKPRLMMLDEPLGSLDRSLRQRLLMDIKAILRQDNLTTLYITHDQEEAFGVADSIILMDAGKVIQIGTPKEIYHHPNSEFTARFLGFSNILEGKIKDSVLETEIGSFEFKADVVGQVLVLMRPDSIQLNQVGNADVQTRLVGVRFQGGISRIEVEAAGKGLYFDVPSSADLPDVGEKLKLSFDPQTAFQILNR